MRSYVLGAGMTRFTRQTERSAESLVVEAVRRALDDAGADWNDVDAVFVGSFYLHQGLGQRLLMQTPLLGKPVVNVENACASSGTAMREALAWLEAGFCRTALAVGVETLTRMDSSGLGPPDEDLMGWFGGTFASSYALKARRHIDAYGLRPEQLAAVTVKSRRHAQHNPLAHFREPTTVEAVLASPMIADPLTRLQCCPNVDGAAAVLLGVDEVLPRFAAPPLRVLASSMVSGRRRDHRDSEWDAVRRAAQAAYEQAGLGPSDLDLIEVHDACSIAEITHCEDLGLCAAGEGGAYVAGGKATIGGGGVAVNPSGGLLSRGHPMGASGLAQIHELALQLRGRAGARQVADARTGLAHIMGGNVSELDSNACLVHILQAASPS
ncbi:MAG: thiolase family protein [Burkholderiaceae bacterium]